MLVGCSEEIAVRQYTVAKQDVRRAAQKESVAGEDQQMLGAIVPSGQSAWFFKLMDVPEKVAKQESAFRSILDSLSFGENGEPRFEVPEGWTQQDIRQMVYARLTHEQAGLSASVMQLPAPTQDEAGWRNSVLDNVNRWRDQLNLPPVDWTRMEPELEELSRLEQGSAKAYFVNLVGKKSGSGAMASAPFMNGLDNPPATTESPASTRASSAPQPQSSISYTAPEGWSEQPAGGIRLAMFEINEGEQKATVSVSTAGGDADMLVDMWFDQLGMEKTAAAKQQVVEATETVEVQGVESTLFSMKGEKGNSILVVRIPWGERESLFVKLMGATEIVAAQREAFIEFVKSMKW